MTITHPTFEKHTLFTPLTNGYYCYRIPGLIRTMQGTLIAFCEARQHSCSDWGHSAILARRCENPIQHFDHWQKPFIIKESERMVAPRNEIESFTALKLAERYGWKHGLIPVVTNNPVPIVDTFTGEIHLVYCEDYHHAFYTGSVDNGLTWSESVDITNVLEQLRPQYDWTVIASGPGQGLQLQHGEHKGRLIVPFWMASNPADVTAHQPSQVATIYSDDHGSTWQAGEFVPFTVKDPNESKLVQRKDGTVMMISRSNQPLDKDQPVFHKAVSVSPDGISSWSEYRFDKTLPEPRCMGSLARLGDQLLYSSPNPTAISEEFHKRRNLTLWQSADEGRTWTHPLPIDRIDSAYSDLAVDEENGFVYALYEGNYVEGEYGLAGGMKVVKINQDCLRLP